jgi:uncharacterized protein
MAWMAPCSARDDRNARVMAEIVDIGRDAGTRATLLALNNASARETSVLDAAKFAAMIEAAAVATCVAPAAALLLAFDQSSAYDGGHFLWFRARLERFLYVDRVVVSAAARRHGFGRQLYEDLFARAASAGCPMVTCEVNRSPPNPVSDAFHARLGFQPAGEATIPGGEKIVRYLVRHC